MQDHFKTQAWDFALDKLTELVRNDPAWLSSHITVEREIGGFCVTFARLDEVRYTKFIPDHEEATDGQHSGKVRYRSPC